MARSQSIQLDKHHPESPWIGEWRQETPNDTFDGVEGGSPVNGLHRSISLENGEVDELEAHSKIKITYPDGSTIDWMYEEATERIRKQELYSHSGIRGLLLPLWDTSRVWLVLIGTGLGVGVVGAWLDVLVAWLSDLRHGRCAYGFFYNQVACCSGLNPGELCQPWLSWSQWFELRFILMQSMLQASVYVGLAVAFAGTAAILVKSYAPYAFHTGIPEIKAILGGYVLDEFLSPWTLLIKAVGLALSVSSGLSLGKEGPLVHVSCAMAYLLSGFFKGFRQDEVRKRKVLAAAAAAGVSVAFGSPLGGVLFGLEELDTFSDEHVVWRAFVTSAIAAVALQYVDPFGTSKLVLFQVTATEEPWKAFELVPWLFLGVVGGVLGALLIRVNVAWALYRRNSIIREWPLMEVIAVAASTAALSYLVVFTRVQSSELVANLFLECDPLRGDWHGLCNPDARLQNVFLLLVTAALKFGLTAYTFGLKVPAGIFLPTIAIGASLGRAMGLLVQVVHHARPTAWIFSSCPPDPSARCISPGFYAVIGAAALLGGVTRMTISLVVIMFELTGALSHVLPIMIAVMVSKWTGDALGKEGIYASWIALRAYPWLPPIEHRDYGEAASSIGTPVKELVTINGVKSSLSELDTLVKTQPFYGFPVVDGEDLLGFVTRDKLRSALAPLLAERANAHASCTFIKVPQNFAGANLCATLEKAPMQVRSEVAQELIVSMFQRLNLRYLLLSRAGKLMGLITRRDVVRLLMTHFESTPAGALARNGKGVDHEWDAD